MTQLKLRMPMYSLPQTDEQARSGKWSRRVCRPQAKLIRDNHGEMRRFQDLPQESQLAMLHYMAIDGEAWEITDGLESVIDHHQSYLRGGWPSLRSMGKWNGALATELPFYVNKYGRRWFGYIANLRIADLCDAVMQDDDMEEFSRDFTAYHLWYMQNAEKNPAPDPCWPVILSGFPNETLQDGWNRFHQYVERGLKNCRALWYPG